MTTDLDLAALQMATSTLIDALDDVREGEWVLPTPCAEWNLRDLVEHVVGGNWYTVRVLAGDTSEEALAATIARFGDDFVSAASAVESACDQLMAFEVAGALHGHWSHVAGKLVGRQILRLRLHDLIVHTWDINEARRPPAAIPRSLAEWGVSELKNPGSLMAQHFEIPPHGDRPRPADAPLAYLDAFGR